MDSRGQESGPWATMHLAASPLDFCHQVVSLSALSNAIVTLEGS